MATMADTEGHGTYGTVGSPCPLVLVGLKCARCLAFTFYLGGPHPPTKQGVQDHVQDSLDCTSIFICLPLRPTELGHGGGSLRAPTVQKPTPGPRPGACVASPALSVGSLVILSAAAEFGPR